MPNENLLEVVNIPRFLEIFLDSRQSENEFNKSGEIIDSELVLIGYCTYLFGKFYRLLRRKTLKYVSIPAVFLLALDKIMLENYADNKIFDFAHLRML